MKYFIVATLICFLPPPLNAQTKATNKQFTLSGKIIGQDSGYVHLSYWNSSNQYIHDSSYLNRGDFKFLGFINEATSAYFYGNRKSRSVDDPNATDIFLEPTKMQAIFKDGDFKHTKIAGSKTQSQYLVYTKQSDSLYKKWGEMWTDLETAKAKNDTLKINYIYKHKILIYNNEHNNLAFKYIKQFPDFAISAYLLWQQTYRLTIDSLKLFYHLLTPNIQTSLYGKRVKYNIDKNEVLEIGREAPGFSQPDMNGKAVTLKDFRGKYVLLEFWASWCVPCRAENPFLKEAYSKYHDKGFIIISVSINKLEEKTEWLEAIKQDQLEWIQLCDFKDNGGEIINKYNLVGKGIPNNFLIDPEGKLIARDLRGNSLEEKLNEHIK